jgi:hypothetical protein
MPGNDYEKATAERNRSIPQTNMRRRARLQIP